MSHHDSWSTLAPAGAAPGAVPGASETLPLCLCLEAAGSCWKLLQTAGSCWKLLEAHRMQHDNMECMQCKTFQHWRLSFPGKGRLQLPSPNRLNKLNRFHTLYDSTRRHSDEALVSHGVLAAEIIFTTSGAHDLDLYSLYTWIYSYK